MTVATPVTGFQGYVQYGKETTWGTEATTIASAFGKEQSIEIIPEYEIQRIFGAGSRNAQALSSGRFKGMFNMNFTLGTSHWMAAVLGSSSTSGTNPYVHTYSEANILPSITVEAGLDLDTDSVRKFLGTQINEMTMTGRTGDPIRVSLNCLYKTETEGTNFDSNPATDAETPMTFANATIECPDGTQIDIMDSFTVRVLNNVRMIVGCGSGLPQARVFGQRVYEITYSGTYNQALDFLEKFYGGSTGPVSQPAETATIQFNITNGLSGADERHIILDFNNIRIPAHAVRFDGSGEPVMEDVTIWARGTAQFKGEDNTATTIFD